MPLGSPVYKAFNKPKSLAILGRLASEAPNQLVLLALLELAMHKASNYLKPSTQSGLPIYEASNQPTLLTQSRLLVLSQQSPDRMFIVLPMLAPPKSLIIQNTIQRTAQERSRKRDKSWSQLS